MQDREAQAMWQVTCQCGWRVRGSKEVVVPAVQEHGRSAHGLEVSEDDVMKLAVPADNAP